MSNDVSDIPYLILTFTVSHICFFLRSFRPGFAETTPVFTFMFYKSALLAWQIFSDSTSSKPKDYNNGNVDLSTYAFLEQKENKIAEKEYMMRRLSDDMASCIEQFSDLGNLEVFEKWIESVCEACDTWGVGQSAAASFLAMFTDPNA